ncbi:hypothetical protein, partial [Staphylococcus aureus]|uniref:hypothetical protein n=1 Tax=Staphylococcus aureus TaxID=1280 RepID=UPI001612016F
GVLTIVSRQKTEAAGQQFDEEAFAPICDAFEQHLAGVLTIVSRQKTEAAGQQFDEEAFAPICDAFEQ